MASASQAGVIVVNRYDRNVDWNTIPLVDRAGVWTGRKAAEIEQYGQSFLDQNPLVNVSLNVASLTLTVAGGPIKYGLGLAYDEAKGTIQSAVAAGYSNAGWDAENSALGAKGVVLAGGILLSGMGALKLSVAAESVPLSGPRLLATEGNIGTYRDLIRAGAPGDNITPNHIPSANRMAREGVSKGDGIAINMEQPVPGVGGRHRATFTYGTQADINMSARDALAAGVWDSRQIYRRDGLYAPEIRGGLQELIRMNKTHHPDIFRKPGQ
tara:strand:- start:249 stop:1055 length:807 start_codon:yes stop_codon:yes gene_type:complete